MRKRMFIMWFCAAVIAALATGCAQKKEEAPVSTSAETIQEQSVSESETVSEIINESEVVSEIMGIALKDLPLLPFVYTGDDALLPAICSWSESELGQYYESDDAVIIPEPVILYTDNSNEEDIRVWGDFRVDTYRLEGDTLMFESGGSNPGLLHIKKAEDGSYKASEFENVGDGTSFAVDMKRIFGKAPEEAGDLVAAFSKSAEDGTKDRIRWEFLKMYAQVAPHEIHYYKDYGWKAVSLDGNEAPDEFWVDEEPES